MDISQINEAMTKLRCLSVVMPVYNEMATIHEILKRVQAVPLPKEIILVDDGSKDGTRDVLKQISERGLPSSAPHHHPCKVKVILNETNQGKGSCIRIGVEHATGDLLLVQDADLEYNPAEYPRLLEPILSGDADVVFGSRFRGERQRIHLFWHYVGNNILTTFSNMCSNLNLSDMETCYKVFRTDIIKKIPLRSKRFGFEPEITAKVAKLRCRVYEVPISYSGRSYEEGKKINWKDGVSAVWTIFKYWLIDDLNKTNA